MSKAQQKISFVHGGVYKRKSTPLINNSSQKEETKNVSTYTFVSPTIRIQSPRSNDYKNLNIPSKSFIIQDKIKVDMKEYNILHIDDKIKCSLSSNIDNIDSLKIKLKNMKWVLLHHTDSVTLILANKQIQELRSKIRDIEYSFELAVYKYKTASLIEEYKTLLKSSPTTMFVTTVHKNPHFERKMKDIISRYICIAQQYVLIENFIQQADGLKCEECGNMNFIIPTEDETLYICKECNTEVQIFDDTPTFKDTDRVNMSLKYTYTRRGHFIDAMKRFQGIQNTDPHRISNVLEILEEAMCKHNLIKERGKKNSVTKDHLYMFISENKNLSSFYDDINLLFHIVTGESCPDISMYETSLLDDFDRQEEMLEKVKDPNRTNSQNVNYKLYKLLQRQGYNCKKEDFYILKTKTKNDEHDEKMQEAWSLLGWEWING